jgi:hypothetical protein
MLYVNNHRQGLTPRHFVRDPLFRKSEKRVDFYLLFQPSFRRRRREGDRAKRWSGELWPLCLMLSTILLILPHEFYY